MRIRNNLIKTKQTYSCTRIQNQPVYQQFGKQGGKFTFELVQVRVAFLPSETALSPPPGHSTDNLFPSKQIASQSDWSQLVCIGPAQSIIRLSPTLLGLQAMLRVMQEISMIGYMMRLDILLV